MKSYASPVRFFANVVVAAVMLIGSRDTVAATCADVIADGSIAASDCLSILRTAVGSRKCDLECVCDTDGNNHIAASDALRCLRVAVGQTGVALACIVPCCAEPDAPPLQTTGSFGILSETAPIGLTLNTDSFLGAFQGAGGSYTDLHADSDDHVEGIESLSMTVTVDAGKGQFAGWFISAGTEAQAGDNGIVRNMSAYAGGRITFWVKTPVDLIVGIRSGNVASGKETSKRKLSDVAPGIADDCWHKVCLPLDNLVGPPNDADLSKIKVFFVIASNAATGGTGDGVKTFLVDDVRWETPGCD